MAYEREMDTLPTLLWSMALLYLLPLCSDGIARWHVYHQCSNSIAKLYVFSCVHLFMCLFVNAKTLELFVVSS